MNAVSTVETASVVEPKTSVSMRVQSISRISPDAPDRKKQARITTRMGGANLPSSRECDRAPLTCGDPSRLFRAAGQPGLEDACQIRNLEHAWCDGDGYRWSGATAGCGARRRW